MHFDYLQIMHEGFRRSGDELFWNEGRREYKPEDLMDALPYADEEIFPTNFNWMYDTDWNLSGRIVFFS